MAGWTLHSCLIKCTQSFVFCCWQAGNSSIGGIWPGFSRGNPWFRLMHIQPTRHSCFILAPIARLCYQGQRLAHLLESIMSSWILSILLLWTCFEGFYHETQRCVHTVLTTTSSSTASFQKRVSLLLICQYYSFQSPKKPSFFHCLGFCPQPYLKPRLPLAKVHTAKYVA